MSQEQVHGNGARSFLLLGSDPTSCDMISVPKQVLKGEAMQTLPSQELKRRGLAAVESLIEDGPVEVIKRNRPACVIVSVGLFRDLTRKRLTGGRHTVSELFAQPAKGFRQRKEVDAAIREERASWGGR